MPNPPTKVRTNSTPLSENSTAQSADVSTALERISKGRPIRRPDWRISKSMRDQDERNFPRNRQQHEVVFSEGIETYAGKTDARAVLNRKATATRAYELAEWLKLRPFLGVGKPENITGQDWQNKIKGRTGIIYFFGYWRQEGDSADALSGGHIDLEQRHPDSLCRVVLAVSHRCTEHDQPARLSSGRRGNWYSDLADSKEILFWEVK